MTNNLPNDDSPNDDFTISEDKLREFLESSQKDFDYQNPIDNAVWGANIKDREIIDFIERVERIRDSMEAEKRVDISDLNRAVDKIESLHSVSQEDIAKLIELIKNPTDEIQLRTVDPSIIEKLADIVDFQNDRIISILKQLSTLRVIVFGLATTVMMLVIFIVGVAIAVSK
jgi:hypothetical protein